MRKTSSRRISYPVDTSDSTLRLVNHIKNTLGCDGAKWTRWPGGWPDQIGTALVDAVYSARAVYETKAGGGVLPKVRAWRTVSSATNSLSALVAEIGDHPESWAKEFGNSQHAPGRNKQRPGDATKASAIREAAENLLRVSIETADDLRKVDPGVARAAVRSVPGIGLATTNYFFMLLGVPGVKPDVMVRRFVRGALGAGTSVTDARADELVSAAAAELGVAPHELDHAIWAYQRSPK